MLGAVMHGHEQMQTAIKAINELVKDAGVQPWAWQPPVEDSALKNALQAEFGPLIAEGYRIKEYKGIVRGIIVRSPTIMQGLLGGLKSVIGGRISAYTEMCEQARQQAYDLLIEHARAVGANAIVGMRYDASEVVSRESATEVLCYGTAVVIERST